MQCCPPTTLGQFICIGGYFLFQFRPSSHAVPATSNFGLGRLSNLQAACLLLDGDRLLCCQDGHPSHFQHVCLSLSLIVKLGACLATMIATSLVVTYCWSSITTVIHSLFVTTSSLNLSPHRRQRQSQLPFLFRIARYMFSNMFNLRGTIEKCRMFWVYFRILGYLGLLYLVKHSIYYTRVKSSSFHICILDLLDFHIYKL